MTKVIPDVLVARSLAIRKLSEYSSFPWDVELVLMDEQTETTENGWVFFYQSAEYLRTGHYWDQLAGNCPIYVSQSGSVHELPTYDTWQNGVSRIEAN